jgi:hypothetical protein
MKFLLPAFFIFSAIIGFAAPMYFPVESITLETKHLGDNPRCQVHLHLDAELKHISEATLVIEEEKYIFPAETLLKIEYPDLASTRVETEKGRDGRLWFSIVLRPSRSTQYPTRFHITVIDGKFAQVSKSWDEPQGDSTRRHFEILHEQKQ